MSRIVRHTLAAVTAGLLFGLSAFVGPYAAAHDSVIGGDPHNQEVVDSFPETVTLEFSGYVKDDFNTFAVSDADTQEVLFSGEPTVEGRMVSLEVPPGIDPGPGNYRIGFQITSSDGHATRGMTTFTVAGEANGEDSPDGASAPSNTEASAQESVQEVSSVPWGWITGAGLAFLLIAGAIIAVAARRK